MNYIGKNFLIEKVSALKLSKKYGSPIYCYSYNKIKKNILSLKKNKIDDKKLKFENIRFNKILKKI